MTGWTDMESQWSADMVDWYKEFHENPELSMREFNTTRRVKEILMGMGISPMALATEVGVVAVIQGGNPGVQVVLRADIDALPIREQSGLPFASRVDGVSHMCGHDFHTSALLGAARLLQEHRSDWNGSVKLLFQPGEETTAGAKYMLEKGALSGLEIAVFGLHNTPHLPAGTIGIRSGPFFASADTLHITVKGRKGHAALPHRAVDATVAASAIVMGLQTAVSRNVDPLEPVVLTIGSLQSGEGHNIISDHAEMWGTFRTFSKAVREQLREVIPRLVFNIAAGYGATVETEILPQTPEVNNDITLTEVLRKAALRVLPQERVLDADRIMAAEDFAVYQERIPGCYFLIGTGDLAKNVVESWHHPKFRANEEVIPLAATLLSAAALEKLRG